MGKVGVADIVEVSKETGGGGGGGEEEGKNQGVVRWERFLPRMVVRVLVVESDDSTRHIIAALLRKSSYKVAAVSDGLKAWELLKGRPHNIDLILTEVELPSISGFALLTLVAEHEICKNIPVIMMSAHDSVSTVYKCMLRGAADFLVKPVRKNELKNLWQHVWRRQASSSGGPQATSDTQQKVEATAENNATSNHSSGYEACIQSNRDCIEKGSDAQSSCTKPDLVAEGAHLGNMEDLPHLNLITSQSLDAEMQKGEQCIEKSEQMPTNEGSAAIPNIRFDPVTLKGDTAVDIQCGFATDTNETLDNNNVHINSSREAIDLIGTFDRNPKRSYRSLNSNYYADRVDSSSLLDLSLRRSHPSGSVKQVMDDRHRLKQSDASAFSRYVSKALQPLHSTSTSICNQQRAYENNSGKQIFHQPRDHNSDTCGPTVVDHDNSMISLTNGQAEMQVPYPQQRVVPVTVPVRNFFLESQCNANGYALPSGTMPPVFSQQSSRSPLQSPVSSAYPEPPFQVSQTYPFNPESSSSQQLKYLMDQQIHNTSDQMEQNKGQKLESEDRQFSSAADHSVSGNFCNGSLSRFNSINSGSNGNTVSATMVAVDNGNEIALDHNGNCNRSMQREAALTKFRLKRKDRCFDKKVRYESRKKLAEQRPRVKGQFVRQVCTDAPSIETDSHLSHQQVS